MNETKARSHYEACKAIREALASPLFPPGEYRGQDISEKLVKTGIAQPWELNTTTISDQTKRAGWERNGKSTKACRFIKPKPQAPAPRPLPTHDDEPHHGPVTQRLAKLEQSVARCEAMLAAIIENLGITVKG